MSIDENGILDPDAASWIQKYREQYAALFEVCEAINRLAQTSLFKLNIHSENVQEVLVALLFIRSLNTYQTSILLIERGLSGEARVILRVLLEILFKLRAISQDWDVARAYVQEDEIFRKKFVNKFKMLSEAVRQDHGNPRLDELLQVLNADIQNKGITERQTQWYAQKAGLTDHYNSAYSIFSAAVHANVRDIESLIRTDGNGRITEILYGPDLAEDTDTLLLTGGEAQCLILHDVSRLFNLNLSKEIESQHGRLKELIVKGSGTTAANNGPRPRAGLSGYARPSVHPNSSRPTGILDKPIDRSQHRGCLPSLSATEIACFGGSSSADRSCSTP